MDYAQMTPEQKRVAIAAEVIANARAGRFCMTTQAYLAPVGNTLVPAIDQDTVVDVMESCEVCALGAMMLTRIERFNGISLPETYYSGSQECIYALKDAFTARQLRLIESAYQAYCFDNCDDAHREAERFGHKFQCDSDRLIAIMQNVIDNNGEFVPVSE